MRLIWASVLGLAALAAAPAEAAFRRQERLPAPWCAVFSIGWGDTQWECVYPTLEACVPNILAGTRGFCHPNPRYPGLVPEQRPHRRKH